MAATAVCAILHESNGFVGWVGDSPAMLYRDGQLRVLTHPHTKAYELLDRGLISRRDVAFHPESHAITRYLGQASGFDIDFVTFQIQPGDLLILSSDGLTDALSETDLQEFLRSHWRKNLNVDELPAALVRQAVLNGSTDNISVICCEIDTPQPQKQRTTTGAYRTQFAQTAAAKFKGVLRND